MEMRAPLTSDQGMTVAFELRLRTRDVAARGEDTHRRARLGSDVEAPDLLIPEVE